MHPQSWWFDLCIVKSHNVMKIISVLLKELTMHRLDVYHIELTGGWDAILWPVVNYNGVWAGSLDEMIFLVGGGTRLSWFVLSPMKPHHVDKSINISL